ncbi:MAG: hypothetical protein LAT82_01425 [Nanoarchaeota archaeon]|nr:hypothetical protein [Nanoarchaeota archaeon]
MNSNILQLLILLLAVIVGSTLGIFNLGIESEFILDIAIISLLFSVFLQIPIHSFSSFKSILKYKKYISIAWILNFIIIPTLAFLLALIFFEKNSALFLGVLIYLIAPCTDWVLGFTKKSGGDEVANSLLLPLNLLSQILLLPIYLYLFTGVESLPQIEIMIETLLLWILLPFTLAQIVKIIQSTFFKTNNYIETYSQLLMDISLVVLIIQIFSLNIDTLLYHISAVALVLGVVLIFFIIVYYIVKIISNIWSLSSPLEKSLTMTTAARNAPLMFAISLILFPEMVLIHSVIIIGMLLEFPHLIFLTHILSQK